MVNFKTIPNHPGYFAGDDGEIYSSLRKGKPRNFNSLRKLKSNIQSSGRYYIVAIKTGNKFKTQRVHRLICSSFHGIPTAKQAVSHLDGNWKNNKPENLKWESYSENNNRKKEHGTDDIGIKNSRAKIDLITLKEIRKLLNEGKTHQLIGDKFGLNRVFITKIANGHRYKGQGF